MNTVSDEKEKKKKPHLKKIAWSVFFVIIACASIWIITNQSQSFSFDAFLKFTKNASMPWLISAIVASLCNILFEACALVVLLRSVGFKSNLFKGLTYSASDIYFSAITPSATGGQPASALFMINDGINAADSTVTLLMNLVLYTISIVVISIASAFIYPDIFSNFGTFSKILIIIGMIIQFGLTALFLFLLKKESFILKSGTKIISFLNRIHIIKKKAKWQKKLENLISEYANCSTRITGKFRYLFLAFLFNLLQRISLISVTAFTFVACGGSISYFPEIWTAQAFTVLGSNFVPIPGGIGVTDFLLFDGLENFVSEEMIVNLELLIRSVSFYFTIVLCGLFILTVYLVRLIRNRKGR